MGIKPINGYFLFLKSGNQRLLSHKIRSLYQNILYSIHSRENIIERWLGLLKTVIKNYKAESTNQFESSDGEI